MVRQTVVHGKGLCGESRNIGIYNKCEKKGESKCGFCNQLVECWDMYEGTRLAYVYFLPTLNSDLSPFIILLAYTSLWLPRNSNTHSAHICALFDVRSRLSIQKTSALLGCYVEPIGIVIA